MPLTRELVVDLWAGDGDCAGYHHEELVVAACELVSAPGPANVAAVFYPGVLLDAIEEEDRLLIQRGYDLYLRRLALPRKRSGVVGRVYQALGR